jgi:hypothetical protein
MMFVKCHAKIFYIFLQTLFQRTADWSEPIITPLYKDTNKR